MESNRFKTPLVNKLFQESSEKTSTGKIKSFGSNLNVNTDDLNENDELLYDSIMKNYS